MFSCTVLLLLCSLSAVHVLDSARPPFALPRMTVTLPGNSKRLFREEGFWNYSSMLLREDLGLLVVGARDAIYALDIQNVSRKQSEVGWPVTKEEQDTCKSKGKTEADCQNYIRILHKAKDDQMYVCGTSAFSPACYYLTWNGTQLQLQGLKEDGKGKCPFDPHQRYASLMVDGDLYSATAVNFLGSSSAMIRSSTVQLSTEIQDTWFSDPQFISMVEVPESEGSQTGDDDKIYLFFSELAMEYDFYKKLVVSRVARICKGDMGGQRILQKKWTSFLKARLDCPVPDSSLPLIIQDVFLWRDSNWRTSVFYAVFTGSADLSAVCAYVVDTVGQVFSSGKYKKSINVENTHTKWVTYGGELPVPRPGACIDNEARARGVKQSLDIPDSTLQFLRGQPLMDTVVQPLQGGAQLLKRGTVFTRIAVDSVTALDGQRYAVMFIGTEKGSILKAVNYGAEAVIIEELQLFHQPVPIEVLRLSVAQGLLYAGSSSGVAQAPLSGCGRYTTCLDCVLARDPYCVWDSTEDLCTALLQVEPSSNRKLFQSVKDGNASMCPKLGSVEPKNVTVVLGSTVELPCQRGSNLAHTVWFLDSRPLVASQGVHIHGDSLLVLAGPTEGAGLYECQSVEHVNGQNFVTMAAAYRVLPGGIDQLVPMLDSQKKGCNQTALKITMAILSLLLTMLFVWNVCQGHISLPGCKRLRQPTTQPPPLSQGYIGPQAPSEVKLLPNRSSNNNCSGVFSGEGLIHDRINPAPLFNPQFISDESEI